MAISVEMQHQCRMWLRSLLSVAEYWAVGTDTVLMALVASQECTPNPNRGVVAILSL
jgi:hypothetical protein